MDSHYLIRTQQQNGPRCFQVFNCLTVEHDWRLVVLAGAVCLLASAVVISLFHRAQAAQGRTRLIWLSLDAAAAGCGIWATHFIAMLAYDPGVGAGYNLGLTILSLIFAAVITGIGLSMALRDFARWSPAIGGALVGGGVAAMHYTGMAALEIPGRITWSPELVAASIVLGVAFGALALSIAANRDSWQSTLAAAMLLTLAIVYKPNYDPLKAFIPVASLGNGASLLTVHPSVPANSVKELVALAKDKPGTLHFAHAGIGSFTHTASVLFAMMAGIDVVQVPFKGGGPAMIDVVGGHTQLLMNSLVASMPHVRSGKLRALGVSDTRRSDLLPDLPTIAEAGVPGYAAANWWGIAVPVGTPQPIIARLNREITGLINSDEVRKQFDAQGAVPVPMTTAEFAKFYEDELAKWGKVVKAANIKPE